MEDIGVSHRAANAWGLCALLAATAATALYLACEDGHCVLLISPVICSY